MKKYQVVYVKWHDAVSSHDWTDNTEPPEETHVIETVGFLTAKDKNKIVIAMQIDPERQARSMEMTIPIGMVISIKKLTLGRKIK